ncbi:prolyl aminopeptidase [Alteromonas oceanisediminis]|uniref:prolyl aminopeptidase n=1 Tax=Alteromonas oceanisediminis TaxID=2836180 RepID=UPI001BD99D46|nr:prolyl aminopeptidase [Alteromonas oceanisediminis]MBT0587701.1 prolyl aminopeptidase [Alteromonas oceanisediminis]
MPKLFPSLTPFSTEQLSVDQRHTLYLELSGNPDGIPVLYIHGGPGAGLSLSYRSLFDPERYLIIGFDQRGCGKSQPFADLNDNTTDDLVEDIEKIRHYLGISTWLLFGGSWGSTLALVYAIRYPAHVSGLILRGTFLARAQDTAWFLSASGGAASLFPEHYRAFTQLLTDTQDSEQVCEQFYQLFTHADQIKQTQALRLWFSWEERLSRLTLPFPMHISQRDFHFVKSLALLECHYLRHRCFLPENYILENLHHITHLPATIIHGRYDMICKMEAAYSLHQRWHNSTLQIIPDAGHSLSETGISAALVQATQDFAAFLQANQ